MEMHRQSRFGRLLLFLERKLQCTFTLVGGRVDVIFPPRCCGAKLSVQEDMLCPTNIEQRPRCVIFIWKDAESGRNYEEALKFETSLRFQVCTCR